ncbi:MAG TPA: hypothetical protein VED41_07665, partial [Solirubrobacteraceae bacterium]|nr:hypothetical protein [Solirubrobacteraceae bacterium]
GEGPGGFLVSASADALHALAGSAGTRVAIIGTVGGEALTIRAASSPEGEGAGLAASLDELADAHARLGELFS